MADPIKLVSKPTASDEVRESIIKVLRDTLNEAVAGEIRSVVVLAEYADGEWINRASDTLEFSKAIGRLEITKQEWVAQYLKNKD
jgi:hypothetical protein